MKMVEPHELSALLDGELKPKREAEVRAAIRQDAGLQAEFDRLQTLDREWSAAAQTANFAPRVSVGSIVLSGKAAASIRGADSNLHLARLMSVLLVILLSIRLLTKMLPAEVGWAVLLHSLALLLVIGCVIKLATAVPSNTAQATPASD